MDYLIRGHMLADVPAGLDLSMVFGRLIDEFKKVHDDKDFKFSSQNLKKANEILKDILKK